jgi:hypothetical protein
MNQNDDEVIQISLPRKDYKVLRDIIEERQAMNGLKNWITTRLFWLASGLLALFGVYEAFKRFGADL